MTEIVCPTCKGDLIPHCSNPQCGWATCTDCLRWGVPEEGRWIEDFWDRRQR